MLNILSILIGLVAADLRDPRRYPAARLGSTGSALPIGVVGAGRSACCRRSNAGRNLNIVLILIFAAVRLSLGGGFI